METKKLNLKELFISLTKEEMKSIMAGSGSCLAIGQPCQNNIQCCSGPCSEDGNSITGKSCHAE